LELGAVLLAAVVIRLAFLSNDPPVLLTTDSLTYALPAHQLAEGHGFDLSLRRTPGYPLFLAALWAAFGNDFHPLVYAQHLLGVVTAGFTWLLGRLALGRVAGLLGGLAVALSGPQIIYEHYLMTESLFTLLLVLATLTLVRGLLPMSKRVRGWSTLGWFLASGLLFGLCALTRPIGQIFPVVVVPLAVLLAVAKVPGRLAERIKFTAQAALLTLVGFGLVALPWMARNWFVGGQLTSSSALGKTLFGRITRHDDGLRFDLPPGWSPENDPRRAEARAVARGAAQDDTSRGSLVHLRLMREFGYTEAQAYNVMRDAALEVLLAQPVYYLQSSLRGTVELLLGQEESLRAHLERLANPRLRREWQQTPQLASLLPDPVPPEVRVQTLGRAIAAVRIHQPSNPTVAAVLAVMFLIGALAILFRPGWQAAAPLPLVAATVLVASAFLDGPVPRFRYPVDPFITLTAVAALAAVGDSAKHLARRVTHRPERPFEERTAQRRIPAVAGSVGQSSPEGAQPK
jgi:4-amino-4-deoxy-L-arabinose transferase-like glycosyltransferase